MNPVDLSLIGHAFVAIADEMAVNVYRSAHSTVIREAKDVATALLDVEGNTIAMAAGFVPPILLGAMEPAAHQLRKEFDFTQLAPHEALLTNNPFAGGQHVNDFLLFTPIHFQHEVIGLAAATVHHLDVGGAAAGASPEAVEVFQEGIVFPGIRLDLSDGWERSTFGKILRANIRAPGPTLADFGAQIAACRTGQRRVVELAQKYGKRAIQEFVQEVQDYADRVVGAAISKIPEGDYFAESSVEDDGTGAPGPFRVRMMLTVKDGQVTVDFSGTDRQANGFVNMPLASTYSVVRVTLMMILQIAHRLINGGAFRRIHIVAPRGTLVNPDWPAATRARTGMGYRVFEAINLALADVLPQQVIAPGFDAQGSINLATRQDGKYFAVTDITGAGGGATYNQDGIDGTSLYLSNVTNTPIEAVEIEFPFVQVLRYGLVADSGGPGRFRGGLGLERTYKVLHDDVIFSLYSDRHHSSASGLFGGGEGGMGACFVVRDGERKVLPSKVSFNLRRDDVLIVRTGGGGGYGPPNERPTEQISEDLRAGCITDEGAREHYGYSSREKEVR